MSGLVVPLAMLLMRNSQYPFGIGPYAMRKTLAEGSSSLLPLDRSTTCFDKTVPLPVTPRGEQSICLQYSQRPIERNCLLLSWLRSFSDPEVPRIIPGPLFSSVESISIL